MDNFRFLLQSALDVAKSKTNINLDIRGLQSQVDKLRIKAELDPKSLRDVRKQLELITKKASGVGGAVSVSKQIWNVKDLKAQEKVYFRQIDNSIGKMLSRVEEKVRGLGFKNIDISGLESATNAMKEFTATASTAQDIFNKTDFGRVLSQEIKNSQKKHVETNKVAVLNNSAPKEFNREEEKYAQQANDFLTDTLIDGVSKVGFYKSIENQVTDSIDELKKFDSILTQISKNSDLTFSQLKELGDTSFETASKYGQKTSEYLTNIQELYRAGYDNAEPLAELSLLTQSAGDMDATTANNYLIAANAAYKLRGNIEALTEVLDGQTYISKKNALSLTDLAEATKIASYQSASSGIEIDETTAALGTMIATTQQGGAVAASAWKGILMNIQQVKGEVEGGDIIDDEALLNFEKACANLGVSLKEVNGGIISLRDPMTVLKELSEAYTSLDESDARRADLTDAVGGNYNGNHLNALLENYSLYQKMIGEYAQGSGSAMEEAITSANNWEGSLNRLNNTFTDIIGNIANSDTITAAINSLNSLLEMFNNLTSVLGSVGTVGATAGILLFIKNLDYQKVLKIAWILSWSNIDKKMIKWFKVQVYAFGSSKINQRGVTAGINERS